MVQYSTKMIFAVLDVSLIMGLNIGETHKVFFTLIACIVRKTRRVRLHKLPARPQRIRWPLHSQPIAMQLLCYA